jgi:hypothetical protein
MRKRHVIVIAPFYEVKGKIGPGTFTTGKMRKRHVSKNIYYIIVDP